jgi:hypothetical protein
VAERIKGFKKDATKGTPSDGSKKKYREELEGRRLAAVKYLQKHPTASLESVERRYELGEKTLSRSPYKEMIAQFANARGSNKGKARGRGKSHLGKNEKDEADWDVIPDNRRSHEDDVDERLDGEQ